MREISHLLESMRLLCESSHSYLRLHMSKKPLSAKNLVRVVPQKVSFKPKGFWYGCGDEWVEWVRENMPELEYDYLYNVVLKTEKRLVKIRDEEGLIEFSNGYGLSRIPGFSAKDSIDWPAVAKRFDGIEICPYLYSMRMDFEHQRYYPWDVASGCIWNTSIVKELIPLEEMV